MSAWNCWRSGGLLGVLGSERLVLRAHLVQRAHQVFRQIVRHAPRFGLLL